MFGLLAARTVPLLALLGVLAAGVFVFVQVGKLTERANTAEVALATYQRQSEAFAQAASKHAAVVREQQAAALERQKHFDAEIARYEQENARLGRTCPLSDTDVEWLRGPR